MVDILYMILQSLVAIVLVALSFSFSEIVVSLINSVSDIISRITAAWSSRQSRRIYKIGAEARHEVEKVSDEYLRQVIKKTRR